MKRRFWIGSVLLFVFFLSGWTPGFASSTPAEGEKFPDLSLPLPHKVEERQYLNIEHGPFRLSQLDAEVLVIEIFSIYCPHCQKEAPTLKALYRELSENPDTKSRVKLLAIGAGNSEYEVNAFRNLFKIEFPLLPDSDYSIHKRLGEVRTPYFFVLWKKPDGVHVVYSKLGSFGDPGAFIRLIGARTGAGKNK